MAGSGPTSGCGWPATGPQTAELRAATAGDPRIEWLGRISDEEKARRLRGADVFCAPSLDGESFGVVLLEAMAASTAIVASTCPGTATWPGPGATPCWSRRATPPRWPTALTDALERPVPARAAGRVGGVPGRRFSMERLAERYLSMYERVTSGGVGRSPAG